MTPEQIIAEALMGYAERCLDALKVARWRLVRAIPDAAFFGEANMTDPREEPQTCTHGITIGSAAEEYERCAECGASWYAEYIVRGENDALPLKATTRDDAFWKLRKLDEQSPAGSPYRVERRMVRTGPWEAVGDE